MGGGVGSVRSFCSIEELVATAITAEGDGVGAELGSGAMARGVGDASMGAGDAAGVGAIEGCSAIAMGLGVTSSFGCGHRKTHSVAMPQAAIISSEAFPSQAVQ